MNLHRTNLCTIAAVGSILLLTACGITEEIPQAEESARELPSTETECTTEVTTVTPVTTTTTTVTTTAPSVSTEIPTEVVLEVMPSVEVYTEMSLYEFVMDYNVHLEDGEQILDTEALGVHTLPIRFTYDDTLYEKTVEYTVTDTTAPFLLNEGGVVRHKYGKAFDINDYVGVADNCDDTPNITYEGIVDTETCGSYLLAVTAEDDSGNRISWNVTVNVQEEMPSAPDTAERMAFADFCNTYAGENRAFGIDVSRWQNDIDFEAVKAAGCEFVIMRIAVDGDDEISEDICFAQNYAAAKAAGLKVGVYVYTTMHTEEQAHAMSAWLLSRLEGETLDFPIVFDWEDFSHFQKYGMSQHKLHTLLDLFAADLREGGFETMLYSSKNPLLQFWTNREKYPIWLAHYVYETDYDASYAVWQRCAVGRIDGIAGDVDFDIWYTDELRLEEGAEET